MTTTILFLSLAIAFCWVEFIRPAVSLWWWVFSLNNPFEKKPLNCVKCMTGWVALIIGVIIHGWLGLAYLPLGVFVGAMFEVIKMRWL